MSSFLDSTGLSELATKLKSYFCKQDGNYPTLISGGVSVTQIGSTNVDLNDYKGGSTVKFYMWSSNDSANVANKPFSNASFLVVYPQIGADGYGRQICFDRENQHFVTREYTGSQWTTWREIVLDTGAYKALISGELYNACVKWDGAGGRGRLLTYNYPADNTTGVIVYLSAFDTGSTMRGDAILKITGRGNTFKANMYHLTGTHLRGWIDTEVTVDSTNKQVHVYCYSGHADWMYVCGTLLFEGAWGGNQYKVDMVRSTASSSTQKAGSDVSIDSYYIPHSAGTGAGSSSVPTYVTSEGNLNECGLSLNATYIRINSSSYNLYNSLKPSFLCCAILHNATNAAATIGAGSGSYTLQAQSVAVFVWDGTYWYKMPYSN